MFLAQQNRPNRQKIVFRICVLYTVSRLREFYNNVSRIVGRCSRYDIWTAHPELHWNLSHDVDLVVTIIVIVHRRLNYHKRKFLLTRFTTKRNRDNILYFARLSFPSSLNWYWARTISFLFVTSKYFWQKSIIFVPNKSRYHLFISF